ncbi:MAG: FGGY-family carbohydrate kinase [Candidatus Faecivicinus sp.]
MSATIGLDFGTQSARAVLMDAGTGEVLKSCAMRYPHGVLPGDLASAEDYEQALILLLEEVLAGADRGQVKGICADATSLTLVCLDREGRALSRIPGFEDREQAQIKLWKRHAAQPQADEALALARSLGERFLGRTGGTISCEWTLPKLMEIRDADPEVYGHIDLAMDLCEFLTYRLTGTLARSAGSMSYKGLWARDLGFPSGEFLNGLRAGLAEEYAHMLRGPVLRPGDRAGTLRPELCSRLGLGRDVTVAAGLLDGHTAMAAMGALKPGDATLVLGTSSVLAVPAGSLCEIEGICGIALDGQIPGLYCIDSGQNCVGDMLEWYMGSALPAEVLREAEARHISPHQLLAERIERPWESRVTAVDWFNGSRNAPCDLSLTGTLAGLTVDTRPEEIYLALLQAIVCGTGAILDRCGEHGVRVERLRISGGIAGKNPLLMEQYASLLNLPVEVGQVAEGPAMGSAIFAAVAAELHPDLEAAHARMGVHSFARFLPDAAHRGEYARVRRRGERLRRMSAAFCRAEE